MRALVRALVLSCVAVGAAEAQAASTDIYLAPLTRIGDSIVVGSPTNVTHRPGYDNQPGFLPDSRGFLYTVIGADTRSDIWRYDIATRQTTQVTNTPESEYSATVMPGGNRFSVIRVERDSAQRLWSFAMNGTDPQLVLTNLKPVGYHAWLDANRLVTYLLGTPSTLHVINRDGSSDEVRARDVGRAVHRLPTSAGYSYTQRDSARAYWIMAGSLDTAAPVRLVRAPADNEFHVWTPEGVLLTATNGVLVRWNGKAGRDGAWLPVADLAALSGAKNVSRLAVSPDGKWLAFVAEP